MPRELNRSAAFVSDSDPHMVAAFRGAQLARLSELVSTMDPHQMKWGSSTHPAVKPVAGNIRTLALRNLAGKCGLGGSRWMGQFSVGFPITGTLSQEGVSNPVRPSGAALGHGKLSDAAAARFRERSAKSGQKNDSLLWTEALGQVEKGRL